MRFLESSLVIKFDVIDAKEGTLIESLRKLTTSNELLEAIKRNDKEEVLNLLKKNPASIVSRDPDCLQFSAVHFAIEKANI